MMNKRGIIIIIIHICLNVDMYLLWVFGYRN